MVTRKLFSKYEPDVIEAPNLAQVQLDSYGWFFKEGLKELLKDMSPVKDWTEKEFELHFVDYILEKPKFDERVAREKNITYEAPLRIKVELKNKRTGKTVDQELYLGDFPLMTPRGTFIINGVERVVISQLIRSPGAFFSVVRSTGLKNLFADVDTDESMKYILATIAQDSSSSEDEGLIEVYKRIRPGDPATAENSRQMIHNMFFNFSRYDLSRVGRHRMNQRFGLNFDFSESNRTLKPEDIVATLKEIIRLNNNPSAASDNIDHLGNRRVKVLGELLQDKLRVAFSQMERIIKDRMSTMDVETILPSQLINPRPFVARLKEFFASGQLSQFMDQYNPLSELEHKRRLSAMGPGGLTRERASFEVRDVHPSHYGRICPIETPEGPNIGLVGNLSLYAKISPLGFILTPYRKIKSGKVTDEVIYLDASEEEKYIIAQAGIKIDAHGKITEERIPARIHGEAGIAELSEVDFMDVSPKQPFSGATSLIPFLEHDDANRALM